MGLDRVRVVGGSGLKREDSAVSGPEVFIFSLCPPCSLGEGAGVLPISLKNRLRFRVAKKVPGLSGSARGPMMPEAVHKQLSAVYPSVDSGHAEVGPWS